MLTSSSSLSQASGQAGGEKGPEWLILNQPHADCMCSFTHTRVSQILASRLCDAGRVPQSL